MYAATTARARSLPSCPTCAAARLARPSPHARARAQVSAHLLMRPGAERLPPGVLTKARSVGVRNSRLAAAAAAHGLHHLVRIRGARLRDSVRGYAEGVLAAAAAPPPAAGGGGGGAGAAGAAAEGEERSAGAADGDGAGAPAAKRARAGVANGGAARGAAPPQAAARAAAPGGGAPCEVAPSALWDEACEELWRGVWRRRRSKGCAGSAGGGGAAGEAGGAVAEGDGGGGAGTGGGQAVSPLEGSQARPPKVRCVPWQQQQGRVPDPARQHSCTMHSARAPSPTH